MECTPFSPAPGRGSGSELKQISDFMKAVFPGGLHQVLQFHLFPTPDRIHDVHGILKTGVAGNLPDHIDGPDPLARAEQCLDPADVRIVGPRGGPLGCGGDFDGALAVGAFHAALSLRWVERSPAGRAIKHSGVIGHASSDAEWGENRYSAG